MTLPQKKSLSGLLGHITKDSSCRIKAATIFFSETSLRDWISGRSGTFLRLTEASPEFQSYFIAFSDKKSFVGV
ncbi:MAG TPA: hypothetical protein PK486_01220, partial [Trichococcus flocculiformis]|nr:hypothetical protein [Trichococcus flocculiformis]